MFSVSFYDWADISGLRFLFAADVRVGYDYDRDGCSPVTERISLDYSFPVTANLYAIARQVVDDFASYLRP